VWDDAAKREWADDVERRLREVRSQIDPWPIVAGYAIERSGNSVVVFAVLGYKAQRGDRRTSSGTMAVLGRDREGSSGVYSLEARVRRLHEIRMVAEMGC
jgi:hypothetical protein